MDFFMPLQMTRSVKLLPALLTLVRGFPVKLHVVVQTARSVQFLPALTAHKSRLEMILLMLVQMSQSVKLLAALSALVYGIEVELHVMAQIRSSMEHLPASLALVLRIVMVLHVVAQRLFRFEESSLGADRALVFSLLPVNCLVDFQVVLSSEGLATRGTYMRLLSRVAPVVSGERYCACECFQADFAFIRKGSGMFYFLVDFEAAFG